MKKTYEMNRYEFLYKKTENLPEEEWADDTAFDWFSLGVKMADKNPGWINVEDELPPKENNHSNYSIMVIVCNSYSGECTTAKYNYSELKWVCDKWAQNNVDYWLPMPITPKK